MILALVERYQLTASDAAYLELVQRIGLPRATLDSDLRRAAQVEGVAQNDAQTLESYVRFHGSFLDMVYNDHFHHKAANWRVR